MFRERQSPPPEGQEERRSDFEYGENVLQVYREMEKLHPEYAIDPDTLPEGEVTDVSQLGSAFGTKEEMSKVISESDMTETEKERAHEMIDQLYQNYVYSRYNPEWRLKEG